MSGDKYATAPASTTACASSGVCLHTSLIADADMRFRVISGSWMHRTRSGTVPASSTFCARSGEREKEGEMERGGDGDVAGGMDGGGYLGIDAALMGEICYVGLQSQWFG